MKKTTIIILVVVAILLASLCGAAIYIAGQRTANSEPQRIFLPEGTSLDALCDTLHTNGILQEGIKTKIFNSQFSILNSKVTSPALSFEFYLLA
jgi:cell division protein YceG involved in septum cleavage